jgi:hypothetical protein
MVVFIVAILSNHSDKSGKKNVVTYFLSGPTNPVDEDMIDDHFPNEHHFSISIQTP